MTENKKELSNFAFSKDAANYDRSSRCEPLRRVYPRIVEAAISQPFKTILDIGCGTGELLMMIQEQRKSVNLFGVDISEEMIKVAQAKLGSTADLRVSESEKLPFKSGSFDLVLCTFSFHHHPNPMTVFKEMRRVLSSEGRLIMADSLVPFPMRQVMNLLVPVMSKEK